MRNSDVVRIRRQFKSYSKLAQDIQPGGVYAASRQHAQTADQVERPPGGDRGGEQGHDQDPGVGSEESKDLPGSSVEDQISKKDGTEGS